MQNAVLACPAPSGGGAGGDGGVGGAGVVMVKRAALVACLTCPLCRLLLRDAATITECLHTFCRKCISKEFIDKEICYCPTCNIDLGCAPEEKLRVDHSLQYVRSKIFPSKRRKVVDQEAISPVESPVKRKERSLSSLSVHGPRVSIQKCLTKRRTKASCLRSLSLYSTLQGNKDATKKVGGWKPLASHIRVGKSKKSLKSGSEEDNRTGIKSDDPEHGAPSNEAKASLLKRLLESKEHLTKKENLVKKTGSKKVFTLKGKKKIFKAKQPRKKRRLRALWFYLVAAFDQKGQPPLPQLPTKFLRIKDVELPASFIQKYLVQKLNLSSEAEVELMCAGKKVDPAITLHDITDCYLDKGPNGWVRSSVGSPATGFITTVFYSRPELPTPPTPPPPPESHHGAPPHV
ncbi:E3 ubiquitin protein ligase DRIP2-like isoform X1 [Triticum dicoccoides]|uniref:E3 ubiquitin protein ligase DRIP2-like isoform X1 n=1 Tax=Triticum dicoccoides TaxID=85692 RepID=UPI00188E2829|nr:E3 ubiquitin protein ligase DRIP2-like isoform X1 [Triticum dicoccoides]